MKSKIFLLVAILFAVTLAGSPVLALAKKKTHPKRPRKQSLAQEVFKCYPSLKAVLDDTPKMQNDIADKYDLPRLQNRSDLERHVESGYLIRVPDKGKGFYLDGSSFKERGYGDRRYLVPLTQQYLVEKLAAAYSEKFSWLLWQRRLSVTALVRTQDYQQKYLIKKQHNPNARQASGDIPERRSAHLTGCAFDISTKGLSREQILWLASFLDNDMREGIVLAIYEPNQHNFHVMVIPKMRGLAQ